jgi:hypothetical protein
LPRSSNSHGPPSCLHVIVFMSALSRVGRRCGYAISLRTPSRQVLLRSCSMPALIRRSVGVVFCPSPKLAPDRRRTADKTQPQPRHPRPSLASPLARRPSQAARSLWLRAGVRRTTRLATKREQPGGGPTNRVMAPPNAAGDRLGGL